MEPLSSKSQLAQESIHDIWYEYNKITNKLKEKLGGRSSNIVSEYSERLIHTLVGGTLADVSNYCYDIEGDDKFMYQVKARKLDSDNMCTQLSVIRSWDFHFLIVILFDKNGFLKKAISIPAEIAQKYSIPSKRQNGDIISTTEKFLNDPTMEDITLKLQGIIDVCDII